MSQKKKVLISGHKGRLGHLLANQLLQNPHYEIIGLDRRKDAPNPHGIPSYPFAPFQKKSEQVFSEHQIDAIIHLNILHDPRQSREDHFRFNILGTTHLMEMGAKAGVNKFIFLSSADVYGARPENPQFLSEDAPLMGDTENYGVGDLIQADYQVGNGFWKYPNMKTVILRPSHIVGPVQNAASRYLSLPYPMALLGFSPMIQLIHYQDLLHALELSLDDRVQGIFNICSPGVISLKRLLRDLGRTYFPVPEFLARPAMNVFWETHFSSFPTPEINFLKYSCMVDDSRFRSLFPKYQKFSLRDTFELLTKS